MRLVFPLMIILLGIVLVGFLITNPSQRVEVTVGSTTYSDVPLSLIALIALTVGVAFTAAVALIEGATVRLANRRLRREIQRLESENSFLRTQSSSAMSGPEEHGERLAQELPGESEPRQGDLLAPASAPVYDPRAEDPTDVGNR